MQTYETLQQILNSDQAYAFLEANAAPVGFGQSWTVDGFSVKRIDGTFRIAKAKFTAPTTSRAIPITAAGTCFECDEPEDDHDPTCPLR